MSINLKSLKNYLNLYTTVQIEQSGNQLIINKRVIDIKDKYSALIIYSEAIREMFSNRDMTTIQAFYLQDLVTMYLKEIAKANDIDPNGYRWSADLIKTYPEYGVFYNTIEGFKYHLQALATGVKTGDITYPEKFIKDVLERDIEKYVDATRSGKPIEKDTNTVGYGKSLDDII